MIELAFVCVAYLIGSIPFALIASRAFGIADPRSYGSRNPGATNVLRSGHKGAAIATLAGDAAKGWLAVFLAERLGAQANSGEILVAACGLAAFLGHLFPIFIGFKGGKGVATALGVLTGYSLKLALACAACWLATALITRYSSAAALTAAVAAPVLAYLGGAGSAIIGSTALMAGMLAWRHRANIARLLGGSEPKIGGGKR